MGAVNRERHDAKRWSILDAALRFLRERSVREFRVVDVAKMAGVSKPAVYYYFDDDEALLVEAYKVLLASETAMLAKCAADNLTVKTPTFLPLIRDIEGRVGRGSIKKECGEELASYLAAFESCHVNGDYFFQLLPPRKNEVTNV